MAEIHLVGIVNASPESFSTYYKEATTCIQVAHDFFERGATWVDIGGQATNPGAAPLPIDEEWRRLEPIVIELLPLYPGRLSIDSSRPEIHQRVAALKKGAFIMNVLGMNDPKLRDMAVKLYRTGAVNKIIPVHLPAEFGQDFQAAHASAKLDKAKVVLNELLSHHTQLLLGGVKSRDIVLDPGIGFGKTMRLNWELLRFAELLPAGWPVMIGHSHKRFIGTRTDSDVPLSKDKAYNKSRQDNPGRNHDVAEIAVKAAGNHPTYIRVHELEPYQDLLAA